MEYDTVGSADSAISGLVGLTASYAEFAGNEWDHIATLTHRFDTSTAASEKEVGRFIRKLERLAGNAVNYFGAVETGELGGRSHAHVVLHGTSHLTTENVSATWGAGISTVGIYDPERPFVEYAAKHLPNGEAELLLFDRRRLASSNRKSFHHYHPETSRT